MKITKDRLEQFRNKLEAKACGLRYQLQSNKRSRYVFFLGVSILPLLMLFLVYASASFTYNPLSGSYEKILADSTAHQVENDSVLKQLLDYQKLQKELKDKQNELELARQDSVYLKINLADSSLMLGIKGIDVHDVQLTHIRISRNFGRILPQLRQQWLQHIFVLDSSIATIAKEPIIVKNAPDMPDDSMPAPIPTIHDTLPVMYTLYFHPSLVVQIEQLEAINAVHDELISNYYDEAQVPKQAGVFGKLFFRNHKEAVVVHMAMPAEDAKSIYRAIPRHAKAILKE